MFTGFYCEIESSLIMLVLLATPKLQLVLRKNDSPEVLLLITLPISFAAVKNDYLCKKIKAK
jgi:hypothetical protein